MRTSVIAGWMLGLACAVGVTGSAKGAEGVHAAGKTKDVQHSPCPDSVPSNFMVQLEVTGRNVIDADEVVSKTMTGALALGACLFDDGGFPDGSRRFLFPNTMTLMTEMGGPKVPVYTSSGGVYVWMKDKIFQGISFDEALLPTTSVALWLRSVGIDTYEGNTPGSIVTMFRRYSDQSDQTLFGVGSIGNKQYALTVSNVAFRLQ